MDVILNHLGRSTVGAHVQSVRACAVETYLSILWLCRKTAPKQVNFGFHFPYRFRLKSSFGVQKGCRKNKSKKGPTQVKMSSVAVSQAPLTAPLACALFRQETVLRAQIPKNAARARVLCSNTVLVCCLSWIALQIFRKIQCQEHIVNDLTRPRQRPGELIHAFIYHIWLAWYLVKPVGPNISEFEFLQYLDLGGRVQGWGSECRPQNGGLIGPNRAKQIRRLFVFFLCCLMFFIVFLRFISFPNG